jgi:hypothetical protein
VSGKEYDVRGGRKRKIRRKMKGTKKVMWEQKNKIRNVA